MKVRYLTELTNQAKAWRENSTKNMEGVKLVEKVVIVPEKPTNRRRIFLSNLDLPLVAYQESVSFYDPPEKKISFSESYNTLFRALRSLLVPYDFFVGRLVPALEDNRRLEIDCNGASVVVAAARTGASLSQLGGLFSPKPNFKQLVAFLSEEGEDEMELKDKPLLYIQLTQFGCGSLALVSRYGKARSIATKMHDEVCSTMLFPVDVRRILVPPVPIGFAGNALVPGFARASVRELKDKEDSYLVRKVQEGVERFDDEYVRSGIDWLEVHRGVACKENSFSLVAWFRLGLEEDVFFMGET
ncbi:TRICHOTHECENE 3-O-ACETYLTRANSFERASE [Salix koriyanagi]|uniref:TRICHOTHECENE 3-O-ACETYLTRANSFERASE n=1 Tax=Salix koriyanagi TaxID=2511006 RepID=A0A9Q0TFZ7_9ROSI|nr:TRICHOTHECENE 3-O-ACETYLTRANSFERASE [Salix koriyanagi]